MCAYWKIGVAILRMCVVCASVVSVCASGACASVVCVGCVPQLSVRRMFAWVCAYVVCS